MASFFTINGAAHFASISRGGVAPTQYYVALFTNAVVPTLDVALFGDLTEIDDGNGYPAGGYEIDPNTTDFPTLTKDYTNQWAVLGLIDVVFTAAGGPIPITGDPARWGALTNANATPALRELYFIFDLGGTRVVQDTFPLTLHWGNGLGRFVQS